eukprot:TRINITY_DN12748_c0_g1_i1.p1 TRINITY_DN12748_c0_g1~~TRINITY_DN12748_c0_g1_i1.p1  ORF type:complete len:137 (-),score=16.89 TRINITY_DN12748_c0_g1_i1:238-648(-)
MDQQLFLRKKADITCTLLTTVHGHTELAWFVEFWGLRDVISMDVLFYKRDAEKGWQFNPDESGCTPDTVNGKKYIREIYLLSDPETKTARVTAISLSQKFSSKCPGTDHTGLTQKNLCLFCGIRKGSALSTTSHQR